EASPVAEEPTGFNPLKAPKKAMQGAARAVGGATGAVTGAAKKGVSWIPGVGKKDEMETGITATPRSQPEPSPVASDGGDSGGGMLSKIPLIGGIGHRGDRAVEPEPTVATASVPAESGEKTGFMKGLTSKIPFVGKKDEGTEGGSSQEAVASVGGVNDGATAAPPVPPVAMGDGGVGDGVTAPPFMGPQSAQPMASEGGSVGVPSEEKSGGMFGGFKGLVSKVVPGGGSDSGMSGGNGQIDASLFPQDGEPEKLMADQSAGKKKLFKMPELPDISVPSLPSIPTPEAKQPMPKKTVAPATFVVHRDGAQFMRFGADALGSESQTLRAGTVVTRTKVGDEWSTIQLSDGSTGIIRNGDIKEGSGGGTAPLASAPVGPSNSGLATTSPSGGVRITAPVSATGAGVSNVPGPPVSLPTSSLTGNGPIPPASSVVPPIP
ncbi:MAG: hypothetical protein KDM63_04060, partial [Verrucomicrobiae bacterium]|nr:hypothetical protein [Verrucomicrobiae bacterium]